MLSDRDIRAELDSGRLVVTPLGDRAIQPCSIDVRLGGPLLFEGDEVDLDTWRRYPLDPGEFVLATTVERVEIPPDLCCFVHGRSTTGRQGLIIETAGLVDPGFRGQITLEIVNVSFHPIELVPRMGIAQLTFTRLSSPAERPYGTPGLGSKYQDQSGATEPRTGSAA
jgi:dCTP deaminase